VEEPPVEAPVAAAAEPTAAAGPPAAAAAPAVAAEPAPPAAEAPEPPAPRPAPPARPLPAARPAGAPPARSAAGAPARPAPARPAAAAVAARPAAAGATSERLAAAVRREPAPTTGGGSAQAESLVYVWPHLVSIEFIASVLMLLSMVILSWVVNAPLEAHANPDRTPNPSKAPWYFLNLQELLLHMHPALAGVIVPSAALGAIAAIPFFDRDTTDVGKWFGTAKARAIAIFVTVYTVIVEVSLVTFDEFYGVKPLMTMIAQLTGIGYFKEVEPFGVALLSMPNVIVPTILMLGPIAPLMWFIMKRWKPNTREVMVALFTGFVASYVLLTIFGTFFRGQGMHLCWLTDPCQIRLE
jgi:hypothetical protein